MSVEDIFFMHIHSSQHGDIIPPKKKNGDIIIRVNCKIHLWNLGLLGFYTLKCEKLNFIP